MRGKADFSIFLAPGRDSSQKRAVYLRNLLLNQQALHSYGGIYCWGLWQSNLHFLPVETAGKGLVPAD
jgi:hypothetical protein